MLFHEAAWSSPSSSIRFAAGRTLARNDGGGHGRVGAPVYGPLIADAAAAHAVFDTDGLELVAKFIRIERELLDKHTKRVAAMGLPVVSPEASPGSPRPAAAGRRH